MPSRKESVKRKGKGIYIPNYSVGNVLCSKFILKKKDFTFRKIYKFFKIIENDPKNSILEVVLLSYQNINSNRNNDVDFNEDEFKDLDSKIIDEITLQYTLIKPNLSTKNLRSQKKIQMVWSEYYQTFVPINIVNRLNEKKWSTLKEKLKIETKLYNSSKDYTNIEIL